MEATRLEGGAGGLHVGVLARHTCLSAAEEYGAVCLPLAVAGNRLGRRGVQGLCAVSLVSVWYNLQKVVHVLTYFGGSAALSLTSAGVYVMYLLALLSTAASRIRQLSPPTVLLLACSSVTALALLVEALVSAALTEGASSMSFLGLHAILNFHTFALSFVYAPYITREPASRCVLFVCLFICL